MKLTAENEVPPQAVDIERALLGSMLLDRESVGIAITEKIDGAFYHPQNAILFSAMSHLYLTDSPIDQLSVKEYLKSIGKLELAGGEEILPALVSEAANPATVEYYCRVLKEKASLRSLITLSTSVRSRCMEGNVSADSILSDMNRGIIQIINSTDSFDNMRLLTDEFPEVLKTIEKRANAEHGLTGIPTGFTKLDELSGGWQKGEYIIVGAPTGAGKTTLGLHFIAAAAIAGVPTAVFSMEMTRQEIAEKYVSRKAMFNTRSAFYKKPTDYEWDRMVNGCADMSGWKVYADQTAGMNIAQLSAKINAVVKKYDVKLVVVDHIQLMRGMRENGRVEQLEHISQELKSIAIAQEISIICISQYSRGVKGEERRPVLGDLKGTGSLECDANIVIFLHNPTADERRQLPTSEDIPETRLLIVAKSRHSTTRDIVVQFKPEIATFTEM